MKNITIIGSGSFRKSKKSKFNVINTPQTTKSNSIIDSQNNLENDKDIDKKNDNEKSDSKLKEIQ